MINNVNKKSFLENARGNSKRNLNLNVNIKIKTNN